MILVTRSRVLCQMGWSKVVTALFGSEIAFGGYFRFGLIRHQTAEHLALRRTARWAWKRSSVPSDRGGLSATDCGQTNDTKQGPRHLVLGPLASGRLITSLRILQAAARSLVGISVHSADCS